MQGPDGVRRLKAGPNISTYRGLNIIHSRSFSMEEGAPPRDVLRRRVRVAEYYRIPWQEGNDKRSYGFYDESKDAWTKIKWTELERMSRLPGENAREKVENVEIVVIRPNIEHNMLGIIMGRGGLEELGATFWGQTELSCYDDSMHGIWGMSYKYNEKAIVINNKNLIRLWDVAYDGYNGGKDCVAVDWNDIHGLEDFKNEHTYETGRPYEGPSMMVMSFDSKDDDKPWPSPILFHDSKSPFPLLPLCLLFLFILLNH
jgi:hypothetical protein